jgi:hypothetical protein
LGFGAQVKDATEPNIGCTVMVTLLQTYSTLRINVVGTGFTHIERAPILYSVLELQELNRLIWMPMEWLYQEPDEDFLHPSWYNMLVSHPKGLEAAAAAVQAAHERFYEEC